MCWDLFDLRGLVLLRPIDPERGVDPARVDPPLAADLPGVRDAAVGAHLHDRLHAVGPEKWHRFLGRERSYGAPFFGAICENRSYGAPDSGGDTLLA
jgi:hypothetical protein